MIESKTLLSIYASIRRYVRRLGITRLGADLVDDVVQQSFVAFYSSPSRAQIAQPEAWLKVTARRLAFRKVSHERRMTQLAPEVCRTEASAERNVVARQGARAVRAQLVASYPRAVALVDRLSVDPEQTTEELAEKLGMSHANVYQVLSRARRTLGVATPFGGAE